MKIIVPIGDRFSMGARSAFTCEKFFELILPCHYGTLPGMLDLTADKFMAEMRATTCSCPKSGR